LNDSAQNYMMSLMQFQTVRMRLINTLRAHIAIFYFSWRGVLLLKFVSF
jgi:hypothetical protein